MEAFAFRPGLHLQSLVGRHPNIGQPRNQRTIISRPTGGAVPFDSTRSATLPRPAPSMRAAAAIAAVNARWPETRRNGGKPP